jgi:hypothetical protein
VCTGTGTQDDDDTVTLELGESLTCTITNDDIQPLVTVTKTVNPWSDPGRFNLLIDGTEYATNVGDGGSTGQVGIDAGNRTISETGGTVPPTDLANYTTTIDCGPAGSGIGASLNITLNPGDVVNCVITNTVNDDDDDGIPDFLDCSSVHSDRVVDPNDLLAAYLPPDRRHDTLQEAVNAAADNDVIVMVANTTENVEIGGTGAGAAAAGKDLRIIGCGHKIWAADSGLPVIHIFNNAGADDSGNGHGEADIHVDDLDVLGGSIGYLVETSDPGANDTDTMLKAIRATNNGVGVVIIGNGNELRGANGINYNSAGGVQVWGDANDINNNRIEANTGVGLAVTGSSNEVEKNIIVGNALDGLTVDGDANKVDENDVFDNGGHGIVVSGDWNSLKKNEAGDAGQGNGGDGINVAGMGNEITESDVFANAGRGIYVSGTANVLRKNQVGDSGKGNGSGISVAGDGNEVTENDIFANAGTGLTVNGDGNTLKKNDVGDKGKGNAGDGIYLTGNGNTVGKDIDQNNVFANTGSGIVVIGNNNWLNKNDVGDKDKGNGGDGIRVVGYGNKLTENDSFANGGDGFDISGGTAAAPNVLLKNNAGKKGAGNMGNGFRVAGVGNGKTNPVELDQNTAKANKLNGFYVTGTAMQLSKNISGGKKDDDNGDWEFLVAAGNWNMSGNKANDKTVAGSSGSVFPTAGQGTP